MPGLVGGLSPIMSLGLLTNMMNPLLHERCISKVLFLDCALGIANVYLPNFDACSKPFFDAAKNKVVFIDGIVFVPEVVKKSLLDKGYLLSDENNDAQLIMSLFEEFGPTFAKYIDGNFVIIIFDINKKIGSVLI